jgi:predicted MFS family arabinose efflux permease
MRWLPRSPRLRRIVLAYTVNRLGTWFGYVALSIVVFDHTHSAIAVAALLVGGQVLSAFLVPALVARVESSSAPSRLSALYLLEAVLTAALALVVSVDFSLALVLVLVAVDGTAALAASALLRAAASRCARTSVADLAGDEAAYEAAVHEAERSANAAMNVGFAITFTLGPTLAGIAVPTLGASTALLIDVATFLVCAAFLLDFAPDTDDAETRSVRERLRAAREYIREVPTLRRLLIIQTVALTFFTFSGPVEVAYAKVSLHTGGTGYGVLVGVWGLGVTIGSIVFAKSVERSLRMLLSAATLAVGLAYLGWALAPELIVACAIGLVGGVGNGVQWASLISAVQKLTPPDLHGRMMGAVESVGAIAPAVGFSLGGAVTVLSSPRGAFLVAGIGATLSTIGFLRLHIHAPERPATASQQPDTTSPRSESEPTLDPLTAHARSLAGKRPSDAGTHG